MGLSDEPYWQAGAAAAATVRRSGDTDFALRCVAVKDRGACGDGAKGEPPHQCGGSRVSCKAVRGTTRRAPLVYTACSDAATC